MNQSIFASRANSLNARVGAVALAAAALATLVLSHAALPLTPLRLLALALAVFAAWAFCDEMGLRKPLNRAGFVLFVIAAGVKVELALGVSQEFSGRYYLLYASFLSAAIMFWSVAFLHRQRAVKVVGAVGLLATLAPIVALIVGHVAVGAGAVFGVGAALAAAKGGASGAREFVTLVERVFGLWCYVAAWLLWRGHIRHTAPQ